MELYLIRHGDAKRKSEDPKRPLSDKGNKEIGRLAGFLSKLKISPSEIRHSGKLRAKQTADIVAESLPLSGRVKESQGLHPNADVREMEESLRFEEGSVMLVGHMPFLPRLVSLLLASDREKSLVDFGTGSTVCLNRAVSENGTGWKLVWAVNPDILS